MSSSQILMTGSAGFIGNFLKKALLESGHILTELSSDLTDSNAVHNEIQKNKFDLVLHLAGVSNYKFCQENPEQTISVNSIGTYNLLEGVRRTGFKVPFIFFSTGQVYMHGKNRDFPDSGIDVNFPVSFTDNVYSNSKLLAEQNIKAYSEMDIVNGFVLRLFNHTHKSQSPDFFLPSLYHQMTSSGEKKVKLSTGNLDLYRDIGSIFDLQNAILKLVDFINSDSFSTKKTYYEIYNLCSGQPKNLKVLAEQLAKRLDLDVTFEVSSDRLRPGESQKIVGNCDKLKKLLNWNPNCVTEKDLLDSFLA